MRVLDELQKQITQGAYLHVDDEEERRRFLALLRKIFEGEKERLQEEGLVLLAIPAELAKQIAEVEVVP